MSEINRCAMHVPREKLLDEIKEANERKKETLKKHDREFGANRPKIGSYMENIALPELFNFDMNDYYHNAELAMDIDLRYKLFWLDNSHDDGLASLEVNAGSMYYDTTLFGLKINYTKEGVPVFERHPMAENPDILQLAPYDFYNTGEMPMVHKRYKDLKKISEDLYNGEIKVTFPYFGRGPLDIYVQLREYEGFLEDCADNPEYVHELLDYIVEARFRYNKLRAEFLGIDLPSTTTIDDDWINVPFISPSIFEKFVLPAYRKIQEKEGAVTKFHTCGVYGPLLKGLSDTFDKMEAIDISGWNNVTEVDKLARPDIKFHIAYINTFVLTGSREEHRVALEAAKEVVKHRKATINSQAIVRLLGTVDESLFAMNRFIDLARAVMAEA